MSGDIPPFVPCAGCGRDVPNGSIYCPYCCSKDGKQAAIMRGAVIGGLLGLLVGCVVAGAWTALLALIAPHGAGRLAW